MKKSIDTDKQCIERIILHITEIKDCLNDFNVSTYSNLKDSKYAKYIVTQLITNIYELRITLRPDTLRKLIIFDQIELSLARNIASHNYIKVNFKIVYNICLQLVDEPVTSELKSFLEGISDGTYQ